ncbi:MAG: hypothetical protein HC916_01490 [Coleofasciculaceae cyanobacterium SM2_1_6]|nr:hypothetical protein [Coleofasciculaceae cyanobacterium SM2_1_6]
MIHARYLLQIIPFQTSSKVSIALLNQPHLPQISFYSKDRDGEESLSCEPPAARGVRNSCFVLVIAVLNDFTRRRRVKSPTSSNLI